MKNIAMKLLVASTVVLTSACSGAGFPSLLGGDSAENGNIVVRSGSYEDAKGANTGTFVGQRLSLSVRNWNKSKFLTRATAKN